FHEDELWFLEILFAYETEDLRRGPIQLKSAGPKPAFRWHFDLELLDLILLQSEQFRIRKHINDALIIDDMILGRLDLFGMGLYARPTVPFGVQNNTGPGALLVRCEDPIH